ncbi:MBL fold metallo-hydrolase [Massilia endophytica]|uniref:MBL fold metallo-hydrolase n=1 Tax=Massilia endophytica TaxID=2899220 RepID=UPI001E303E14|nr:MBL fold metallo-hydrolase [Massilia endophytica]UGQ48336.1 MBL fold metallo-hydrolase [Massilia endophytica]
MNLRTYFLPFSVALALSARASAPVMATGDQHRVLSVGGAQVIAILDGVQPAVSEALTNIEPSQLAETLAKAGQPNPSPSPVNVYVLRLGERVVLVDAGGGSILPSYRGTLAATLRALGLAPEKVTDVLITHMHADHVGGLLDGTKPMYPNATVHVHANEAKFWLAPELPSRAPEQFRPLILAIQSALSPYAQAGRLKAFEYKAEILPGIVAQDAGGHTPGHAAFLWKQGKETSLFWGDLIHVADVQLANLDVGTRYDSKPADASAMRQRWLSESAQQGWTVLGAHLPYPGVGTIVRDGERYQWRPIGAGR